VNLGATCIWIWPEPLLAPPEGMDWMILWSMRTHATEGWRDTAGRRGQLASARPHRDSAATPYPPRLRGVVVVAEKKVMPDSSPDFLQALQRALMAAQYFPESTYRVQFHADSRSGMPCR